MEDYQRKKKKNNKRHCGISPKMVTGAQLEGSDSVISEPADNFSDFLYWREPIAALDLDDAVMNSESNCVNDNLREKPVVSNIEQNFDKTSITQNPSNARGKSKPNKRKSKTNKKQSSPRLISTTPPETLPSEKSSVAIGKFMVKWTKIIDF